MTTRNPQSLIKELGRVDDPWTEQAACARVTPAQMRFFFPDSGDDVHAFAQAAKAICEVCPVDHAICLAYGDRVSKAWGTYGGRTASERKARRSMGRAA